MKILCSPFCWNCNRGQQLSVLLTARRLAGYANHPQFEEVKLAVMEEVLSLMESVEQWLESVSQLREKEAGHQPPAKGGFSDYATSATAGNADGEAAGRPAADSAQQLLMDPIAMLAWT
jgi:hypothetical protein